MLFRSDLDPELKKRYIGEAKVLRAYNYYELYTKFGDIPYTTKVLSIKESMSIARTDRATVIANMLADLDEVINGNYLPTSYDADNKGRITRWAAMAIKAKIYLFEGNWTQVKNITSTIMSEGGFTLFGSYAGLFEIANEYNSEVILDAQYRPTSREHQMMYAFLPPSLGGYSQLSPLQELVDSYIMLDGKTIKETGTSFDESNPYANRDPRLKATVMYTGNSYTLADGTEVVINCEKGEGKDGYGVGSDCSATGYYIKKYWDNTYRATLYSGLNPILIRYADILLLVHSRRQSAIQIGRQSAHLSLGEYRRRPSNACLPRNPWRRVVALGSVARIALPGFRLGRHHAAVRPFAPVVETRR